MSSKKSLLSALAISLLLVSGLVIGQSRELQAARARLSEAMFQRDRLMVESRTLRSSITRLERDKEQLREAPSAMNLLAPPPEGMDTPEQHGARIRILRAWLALNYSPLIRKLGLSPEQVNKCEELAIGHFQRVQDIAATAQAEKLAYSDPAISSLWKDENRQYQQAITDMLGVSMSLQLQQYDRTAAARMLTNAVAGDTYYTDSPLNAEQADQLTQILANNSASYQKGYSAAANDIDFVAAISQAQRVLSATQIAALTNLCQGQQAGAKLHQLLSVLNPGAASGPQTPK
jgi:hypothetical protein